MKALFLLLPIFILFACTPANYAYAYKFNRDPARPNCIEVRSANAYAKIQEGVYCLVEVQVK